MAKPGIALRLAAQSGSKRMKIAIVVFLAAQVAFASCTGSSPTWTATPDQTSVASCASSAASGDTINVSAGSATWSSEITFARAIHLIGAGASSVTITCSSGCVAFAPSSGEETKIFEVAGFHFIGNSTIDETGWGHLPAITSMKVHDNNFTGATIRAIWLSGLEFGVFYSNSFSGNYIDFSVIGAGAANGNLYPLCFGCSSYPYFEDNTIGNGTGGEFVSETGQGGRIVIRHNTINGYNSGSGSEFFDFHGEQGSGGWTATFELYDNTIENTGSDPFRWINHRGGQAVIFNNTVDKTMDFDITEYQSWGGNGICNSYPVAYTSSEAYCNAISSKCLETQVHNSFYYNNIDAGSVQTPTLGNPSGGSCGADPPWGDNSYIQQNREYWLPAYGTAAKLPPSCTADGKTFYGTTDTDTIYQCTATNTWTVYYKPYAYPHPLRSSTPTPSPATNLKANPVPQ